jgi:predicted phosphohydrolase
MEHSSNSQAGVPLLAYQGFTSKGWKGPAMRCFAISDLHLSFSSDKPMDRFGPHWARHWEKVEQHWRAAIGEDDLVLLPGDHSWALKLEEADQDLQFIASLPGHKVLSKGNHDYWWQSLSKVRKRHPGLHFLQTDALRLGPAAICATRGWDLPPPDGFDDPQDEKIYLRELERLKLALQALDPAAPCRIAMLHYPPLFPYRRQTAFTDLLEQFRIDICVYGHLHGGHGHKPFTGRKGGVHYQLVACDILNFQPLSIAWPERVDAA